MISQHSLHISHTQSRDRHRHRDPVRDRETSWHGESGEGESLRPPPCSQRFSADRWLPLGPAFLRKAFSIASFCASDICRFLPDAPLLSAQYETLSDSDDWAVRGRALWLWFLLKIKKRNYSALPWFVPRDFSGEPGPWMRKKWWKFIWKIKWEKTNKKTASNTGTSMDYNSGGLKCRVFLKWTILVLTSVCKENHDVFKPIFCK